MEPSSTPCAASLIARLLHSSLAALLLGAALWGAVGLIADLRTLQTERTALAQLRDVQYGLFNAELWIDQVGAILARKIEQFEITAANRPQLKAAIEQLLDRLLVELQGDMQARGASGNWLERVQGGLRHRVQEWLIDFEHLRAQVPNYADQVLLALEQPHTRAKLQAALTHWLETAKSHPLVAVDQRGFDRILAHYGCDTGPACAQQLQTRIRALEHRSRHQAIWVLGLLAALFALEIAVTRHLGSLTAEALGWLSGAVLILLAIGVLTPMLDVEARISELSFQLLGEPVRFSDQVLYFQSKSLMDVVSVFIRTDRADLWLIAGLITLFSLIFPSIKILAGWLYMSGMRDSALIGFFALRSGKWSMADVLVVALFMAYMGFDGLMDSQLQALVGQDPGFKILTTNGTRLGLGFFMFLSFVLGSLIISTLLDREAHAMRAIT